MFEWKLIPDVLSHLPIGKIARVCSAPHSRQWQQLCRDNNLWRHLLYRDYATFAPIIRELERESYMSYFDLYQEFYRNPFFNSSDFRTVYGVLSQHVQPLKFLDANQNVSIIPSLQRDSKVLSRQSQRDAMSIFTHGHAAANLPEEPEPEPELNTIVRFILPKSLTYLEMFDILPDFPIFVSGSFGTSHIIVNIIVGIPVDIRSNTIVLKRRQVA